MALHKEYIKSTKSCVDHYMDVPAQVGWGEYIQNLIGNPVTKWLLQRPKNMLEDISKTDLEDVWGDGLDSFGSGLGFVPGSSEHGNIPL
jgi:hypothetical protein